LLRRSALLFVFAPVLVLTVLVLTVLAWLVLVSLALVLLVLVLLVLVLLEQPVVFAGQPLSPGPSMHSVLGFQF